MQNHIYKCIEKIQLQLIPTLVIGAHAQFVEPGEMVQFFIKNDRMRFNINNINVTNADLAVAASLLELANEVETVNKK